MFNSKINISRFLNNHEFFREMALYFNNRPRQIIGDYVYFNEVPGDEIWFFHERGFWIEVNI